MRSQSGWIDPRSLKRAFSPSVALRSLLVAIVVGTILNVINQGSEIVGGRSVDVLKLLLTFAVPFFVASFGAYSAYTQPDAEPEERLKPD